MTAQVDYHVEDGKVTYHALVNPGGHTAVAYDCDEALDLALCRARASWRKHRDGWWRERVDRLQLRLGLTRAHYLTQRAEEL